MGGDTQPGPPAWLPASVGRAYARGAGTDDDLLSGNAWKHMLRTLARAGVAVRSGRAPSDPADRAAGYRHLLVLLGLGIDEALRRGDPYEPHLRPGNTDAVLKWGMDCPDALYLGAAVRGDAAYRVGGFRGSARYVGFQVMAGIAGVTNVVAEDLSIEPDGSFEFLLSADERPGNWMRLAPEASSLVVRQFFYDWDSEEPVRLSIELIEGGRAFRESAPLSPAGIAGQLEALGDFVEASLEFWTQIQEGLRARGVNTFQEPSARTDIGGAEESVTVWGSWELEEDEALIVEVTPPEALYWSIALGNHWWESIDYANHQCSLNGHQAVVDADGIFRAVISRRDPGVANWLDPAGFRGGPMIMRYVRGSSAPVPATRIVKFEQIESNVPSGTARVDAEGRRAVVARRRAAVRRRFPR